MPLGNLKAIGRLHLSRRASERWSSNCRKGSDEGKGQERAKRKRKNQPREWRTSIALMEPRLSSHWKKLSILARGKSLRWRYFFKEQGRFNIVCLEVIC